MVDHPVTILTSADGQPVALHDFGGSGPPIVLGHGNGLNAGMWAAVVPHLRVERRCFGLDLRGHGACRPTDPHYSVARARFGEDVLAALDAVGRSGADPAPVDYVGHSLGGAAGIYAALAQPDRFRSLWLFEPVVMPADRPRPPGGPGPLIEAARRRRMTFDSVDDAVARLGAKPPFAGCVPESVRAYLEVGTYPTAEGVRLSCEGENEARVFSTGEPLDFDLLTAIGIPTVVAAGSTVAEAHALPAAVAPLIAEALGNARFEAHDGLTHFGPMERPEVVARSILDHVGTPGGTRGGT